MTARAQLRCSSCGTTTDAPCDCGVAYVPAGKLAEEALIKNPEKSDRAIAEEIGVSDRTVNRARKSTATNVAVEKRTGMDGKQRKMPEAKTVETSDPEPMKPSPTAPVTAAVGSSTARLIDDLHAALIDPRADTVKALTTLRAGKVRQIIIQLQAALVEYDDARNKAAVGSGGVVLPFRQGGADEHPL